MAPVLALSSPDAGRPSGAGPRSGYGRASSTPICARRRTSRRLRALTGRRPQALPILIDLATDEVTYIDLYTGEGYRKAVENTHTATADLVAGAVARAGTRMTVADVVRHGVSARGGSLTDERERASVTVGLDEQCTFDVRSPQGLLVEFL